MTEAQALPLDPRPVGWPRRIWALIKFLFCFEIGLFLLVFPWLRTWDVNWFAASTLTLHAIWVSAFFRGAVSGLGLLNVWIGFGELFRMRLRP